MIKKRLISFFMLLALIASCCLPVFGQQDAVFYKQKAEECLSRGECDKAQIMYDAWKQVSNERDATLESRIMNCMNTKNPAPVPDYVEISGIKWATRNIGVSGIFASRPEDYGGYFTFDDAQIACPPGWRVPTGKELESLVYVPSEWTYINDVGGRQFGIGTNTIFLPAAGFRRSSGSTISEQGYVGSHWSSTVNRGRSRRRQDFNTDGVLPVDWPHKGILISVRCVKN